MPSILYVRPLFAGETEEPFVRRPIDSTAAVISGEYILGVAKRHRRLQEDLLRLKPIFHDLGIQLQPIDVLSIRPDDDYWSEARRRSKQCFQPLVQLANLSDMNSPALSSDRFVEQFRYVLGEIALRGVVDVTHAV